MSNGNSSVYVEAELILGQQFEFLVARSAKVDYFLVGLARPPFEKRYRVRTDGITELPAVAVDNLADFFSDNVGRCWVGQRLGEQSPLTPSMRIRSIVGYRLCLGEYRRGDHAGFNDGNPHIESLHFLREALAQCLQSKLRRAVSCCRRHGQPSGDRRDIDDATMPSLTHPGDDGLDSTHRTEDIGLHDFTKPCRGALL